MTNVPNKTELELLLRRIKLVEGQLDLATKSLEQFELDALSSHNLDDTRLLTFQ